MKMKILFLSFFLMSNLLSALANHAPDGTTIGFLPLTYSPRVDRDKVLIIDGHLEETLSKISSISLLNRKHWGKIQQERDLQKTDDFVSSETIEQGRSLGAEKLFYGHVYEFKEDNTKNGPQTKFRISVGIVDVTTGETVASDMFNVSGISDADKAGYLKEDAGTILEALSIFGGDAELTSHMSAALEALDSKVNPFMTDYFGGEVLEKAKRDRNNDVKLPKLNIGSNKDSNSNNNKVKPEDKKFPIVGAETENTIVIGVSAEDKIRKSTRFNLVTEVEKIVTDWNGNETVGTEQIVLAEFKFLEDRKDFVVLEWDKKSEKTIDEIKKMKRDDVKMYIIFKK